MRLDSGNEAQGTMTGCREAGDPYDLLIVGGGIHGAGIARDAAGRGLSVLLVEQDDLAAHTSSASTKLIHGGLRYLELYEFGLVAKALAERDVLLASAPHLVRPLRFVLPHEPHLRPAWLIRAGLFLYDRLDRRRASRLLQSRRIDLRRHEAGAPLKPEFSRGFAYSDLETDDSRLTVLCAMDAAERGAAIATRTRCEQAGRDGGVWRVRLRRSDGDAREVCARALVNATGPWAARFLSDVAQTPQHHALRLIKGSHIVVPKLYEHAQAYVFQQPDRRIVFAIPYRQRFTLIGTTDVEYDRDPAAAVIDTDEAAYLCAAVSRYFRRPITPTDVVWSYAGVRPILAEDDGASAQEASRDYFLELDPAPGAPLLSVFGGKITMHRKLSEEALDQLAPMLGCKRPAWTGNGVTLPGGDLPNADVDRFEYDFLASHDWLPRDLGLRLAGSYGTRALAILDGTRRLQDLGEDFGSGLYEAEVNYLVTHEWARSAQDVLWRRPKLGLLLRADQVARLEARLRDAACRPT